jgi:hypothetical protein
MYVIFYIFMYLFMCDLFNNAVSSSDTVTSEGRIVNECLSGMDVPYQPMPGRSETGVRS